MKIKPKKLIQPLLLFFVATLFTAFYSQCNPLDSHIYIDKDYTYFLSNFPPVPTKDSKQDLADYNAVSEWQKKRTPEQCKESKAEATFNLKTFFGPGHGLLTEKELELVKPLINSVLKDTRPIVFRFKEHYGRPRPYLDHKDLEPCTDLERSKSYPSGHAVNGRVNARIFSYLDPNKARQYFARGDEIGNNRVIGGVHYPSDVASGRILGDMLFAELMKNDQFKADLEQMKNEFDAIAEISASLPTKIAN